jgi:hypothetical protein
MGGELLGPDRDCSRDRSPALQAGSAFMELAGLEPATSWVRSREANKSESGRRHVVPTISRSLRQSVSRLPTNGGDFLRQSIR